MGIFDAVKNRFGRGDQQEYYEDDQYYDDDYGEGEYREEDYRQDEYEDSYEGDGRYNDTAGDPAGASSRTASVFDNYTPLVSMSDVRSQELPAYSERTSVAAGRMRGSNPEIKTSLPYVGNPTDALKSNEYDQAAEVTGAMTPLQRDQKRVYDTKDSDDPLLKRHSLSNTGDFAATSPAYYASRSGVGHVRPSGQARRTHKFREAVVIRPESYAEAEQVAVNIRRGNAVVLVLTQTRPELAKRILDFSFGAAAVSEGQVASIGERIYALTTEHPLTEAEIELLQGRGII